MIIKECGSTGGGCPCTHCIRVSKCGPCVDVVFKDSFDTKNLCSNAREYCERVNRNGRKENKSSL